MCVRRVYDVRPVWLAAVGGTARGAGAPECYLLFCCLVAFTLPCMFLELAYALVSVSFWTAGSAGLAPSSGRAQPADAEVLPAHARSYSSSTAYWKIWQLCVGWALKRCRWAPPPPPFSSPRRCSRGRVRWLPLSASGVSMGR